MKWPLDELRPGRSLKQFGLWDSLQLQLQIQFGVGPRDVESEASSHFSRQSALYHHPSSGRERRNCLGCWRSSRARWDVGHKQTAGHVPKRLAMLSKNPSLDFSVSLVWRPRAVFVRRKPAASSAWVGESGREELGCTICTSDVLWQRYE